MPKMERITDKRLLRMQAEAAERLGLKNPDRLGSTLWVRRKHEYSGN
jgi:hypothetical protein